MAEENILNKIVNENGEENKEDDIVTPWEIASSSEKGVDYDKLIGLKK